MCTCAHQIQQLTSENNQLRGEVERQHRELMGQKYRTLMAVVGTVCGRLENQACPDEFLAAVNEHTGIS